MATLTKKQQDYMAEFLRESLTAEYQRSMDAAGEGQCCPHCGAERVVRKGKTGGKQRYLCKSCNRTFAEDVTGIFHTTSLPLQLWLKYADCVVAGLDARECARRTGVCTRTAESMRRRILACAYKYL